MSTMNLLTIEVETYLSNNGSLETFCVTQALAKSTKIYTLHSSLGTSKIFALSCFPLLWYVWKPLCSSQNYATPTWKG